MKHFIIVFFITSFVIPLSAQHSEHYQMVERFIESLKSKESTMQHLYDEGIINAPEKISDNGSSTYEFYQVMLQALNDQLENCESQGSVYEVLDLKESVRKKGYENNLEIPENGSVYLLYCNEDLITLILIENKYITSFSTMNKGGRRIFFLL